MKVEIKRSGNYDKIKAYHKMNRWGLLIFFPSLVSGALALLMMRKGLNKFEKSHCLHIVVTSIVLLAAVISFHYFAVEAINYAVIEFGESLYFLTGSAIDSAGSFSESTFYISGYSFVILGCYYGYRVFDGYRRFKKNLKAGIF